MKVEGRRKGEGVSISCSHSFNRMAVSIGKAAIKDAQYTAKVGGNCPHECMRQGFIKTCLNATVSLYTSTAGVDQGDYRHSDLHQHYRKIKSDNKCGKTVSGDC